MIQYLNEVFDLELLDWVLLGVAAMLIGMSKTGFGAGYAAVVLIMAYIFGDKSSTGVLVPLLIFADIIAVVYYRREVNWKYIIKLLPWTFLGVGIAVWIGDSVSEQIFGFIMGGIILLGAIIMIVLEIRKSEVIPDYQWFAAIMGLLGGFSTMVGNFAGPVLTVYLLSMRLPKNLFIGTGAWFFFIINLTKVPFHLFVWKTMSWESFQLDLFMIPLIVLGGISGIFIVKLFSDLAYRRLIIAITVFSAFFILF
ncbi:MAG: sulfite exporter TauE/SafE family protein [Bacteroidia bacterium]|nr:sulfite exporter TauE/SafE family protein [Bacteroidia bacterium]